MPYRFEKLTVWQDARKYASIIYKITKNFPQDERFGLTNQMRRAAVSVALNIAEGSDKKSDADFIRFLRMSLGSINEVVTATYIAYDQALLNKKDFDIIYLQSNDLSAKINALVKTLK